MLKSGYFFDIPIFFVPLRCKQVKQLKRVMGKYPITPISPSKCLIKNEMCVFTLNNLSIPTYGFDKPFYAVYDGTLCETLIESIDYYPSHGLSMWNLLLATKDGVVRKSASSDSLGHTRPFSAFSSVEDFENNNPIVHYLDENRLWSKPCFFPFN